MDEAAVLVCGLGALGQACLQRLISCKVPLRCLDRQPPLWRDPALEHALGGTLILGDMRLPHVLRQAGVADARAVLLLSSDGTVNVEAALQVRLLNPHAEIVVRSSSRQADLGALLEERLPGVAVVDPVLLCAGAITSALRPESIPASFEAHGQPFQIVAQRWEDHRFQRPLRARLDRPADPPLLVMPRPRVHLGDPRPRSSDQRRRAWRLRPAPWRDRHQRGLLLAAGGLVALLLLGVRLFADLGGWRQGVFVTLALLKGEYVDPVNLLLQHGAGIAAASGWLIGGTLLYSLLGTLLTSALVAVILERLLRDRLGRGRPRLPRHGGRPILLVEGNGLGQRVAQLLEREGRTLLRVGGTPPTAPRRQALWVEDVPTALGLLGDRPVQAAGLLSPDLLANLQLALSLQQRWPEARIAMLAHAFGSAEQLGELLGGVVVISAMDLVADAMVATAFGERIEAVLRLRGTNLLQVRYRISADDTLCGRTIARLENGYGLSVVSIWRPRRGDPQPMPRLDTVVAPGDQLVVLAGADALRRVELGEATPAGCRLRLCFMGPAQGTRRFEAQQSLARWLGCMPAEVTGLFDGEEHLSPPIDAELCELLIVDLRRQGVRCSVEPANLY